MSSEILKKLISRDVVPTGKLVELLASSDPIVKQMTADYIASTHQNKRLISEQRSEELGLLVTNLLMRDAKDANPVVACSALQALASLPTAPEATLSALVHGLQSNHQKIRRMAALSCITYYSSYHQAAITSGLSDTLYSKIRDSDPMVVANCISALEIILSSEGGIVINKAMAQHLASKLHTFSDSALEVVLTVLKNYVPKDDTERFGILISPLDGCLHNTNPSVLISAIELFLHWTSPHQNLKVEVLKVVQPTICDVFMNASPEMSFLLIDFLISLGETVSEVYHPHFRFFTIKPNDPSYLKSKKIDMLSFVASPHNVQEIISEIRPYCLDYNNYISAMNSLSVLGRISVESRNAVFALLPELLEYSSDNVAFSALECLLKILMSKMCSRKSLFENKSRDNVLSELTGSAIQDNKSACESADSSVIAKSDLPFDIISAVTSLITRPGLSDQNIFLVLYTISELSCQLECSVTTLKNLDCLLTYGKSTSDSSSPMNPDLECLLLTTVAKVFMSKPAESYTLLIRVLQAAMTSQSEQVRENASVVYKTLKLSPYDAATLLRVE